MTSNYLNTTEKLYKLRDIMDKAKNGLDGFLPKTPAVRLSKGTVDQLNTARATNGSPLRLAEVA